MDRTEFRVGPFATKGDAVRDGRDRMQNDGLGKPAPMTLAEAYARVCALSERAASYRYQAVDDAPDHPNYHFWAPV